MCMPALRMGNLGGLEGIYDGRPGKGNVREK